MALRPVSELGLVEVTDVATGAGSARASARAPSRVRASERTRERARKTVHAEEAGGSAASHLAPTVLGGAVGAAGVVLVRRAIHRR